MELRVKSPRSPNGKENEVTGRPIHSSRSRFERDISCRWAARESPAKEGWSTPCAPTLATGLPASCLSSAWVRGRSDADGDAGAAPLEAPLEAPLWAPLSA